MGFVKDSDGNICEEIKWHSRQKHAFLEAYLDIWSDQVERGPTLDIFDLFASYGLCHCSEKNETWDGSALLAAKCLKKYHNGKILFLNTYNPKEEEQNLQKEVLEKYISDLELPERVQNTIETLPIEKALDSAISSANPKFPSFWILDPYQPEHLPWNIVEKICKLEGFYGPKDKLVSRRPELFICLMTGRLQRLTGMGNSEDMDSGVDADSLEYIDSQVDDVIGKTFGMEKEEWKSKLKKYLDKDPNTRKALIYMYAEKLSQYYKKPPIILEVPSNFGNIVYTVFLCSDHDAGHYVMKIHKLPEYQKWQRIEWKGEAKIIKKKRKVISDAEKHGQEQKFLDGFK